MLREKTMGGKIVGHVYALNAAADCELKQHIEIEKLWLLTDLMEN